MPTSIKTIYVGGITNTNDLSIVLTSSTRHDLTSNLNIWLFEHFRMLDQLGFPPPIPPMDDWDHSIDNDAYWSIKFPTDEWTIWIRCDTVNFA